MTDQSTVEASTPSPAVHAAEDVEAFIARVRADVQAALDLGSVEAAFHALLSHVTPGLTVGHVAAVVPSPVAEVPRDETADRLADGSPAPHMEPGA